MMSFGKELTKGKGFRNLFRQNCYKVYLVDEFRTSCRCSKFEICKCEIGECEKFQKREKIKNLINQEKFLYVDYYIVRTVKLC